MSKLTEEESDHTIENDYTIASTLTPYVILDIVNNEIQCYFKTGANQCPLAQMVGTWEIDKNIFKDTKAESKLHTLGVCASHFNFD